MLVSILEISNVWIEENDVEATDSASIENFGFFAGKALFE